MTVVLAGRETTAVLVDVVLPDGVAAVGIQTPWMTPRGNCRYYQKEGGDKRQRCRNEPTDRNTPEHIEGQDSKDNRESKSHRRTDSPSPAPNRGARWIRTAEPAPATSAEARLGDAEGGGASASRSAGTGDMSFRVGLLCCFTRPLLTRPGRSSSAVRRWRCRPDSARAVAGRAVPSLPARLPSGPAPPVRWHPGLRAVGRAGPSSA